jgi:hypothetical protein
MIGTAGPLFALRRWVGYYGRACPKKLGRPSPRRLKVGFLDTGPLRGRGGPTRFSLHSTVRARRGRARAGHFLNPSVQGGTERASSRLVPPVLRRGQGGSANAAIIDAARSLRQRHAQPAHAASIARSRLRGFRCPVSSENGALGGRAVFPPGLPRSARRSRRWGVLRSVIVKLRSKAYQIGAAVSAGFAPGFLSVHWVVRFLVRL